MEGIERYNRNVGVVLLHYDARLIPAAKAASTLSITHECSTDDIPRNGERKPARGMITVYFEW